MEDKISVLKHETWCTRYALPRPCTFARIAHNYPGNRLPLPHLHH